MGFPRGFSNWRIAMSIFDGPDPKFVESFPRTVHEIWLETTKILPQALERSGLPMPVDIRREGYRSSRAFGLLDTYRGRGYLASIQCHWASGEELIAEFDTFVKTIDVLTSKLGEVHLQQGDIPSAEICFGRYTYRRLDPYGTEFLAREAVKLLGGEWLDAPREDLVEPIAELDENGLPVWWGGRRPREYTNDEILERWEHGLPWDPEEYPSRVYDMPRIRSDSE
jgi:hypothetical protein